MSSTNRGGQRTEADYYPTPAWCVHRLLEEVDLPGGQWLEPAAGTGMLIEAVNAVRRDIQWRAVELRDACESPLSRVVGPSGQVSIMDFLQVAPPDSEQECTVIITNPPYSRAMPMIEHSLEFGARFIVMLLRLNFLASESRATFMRQHSPDVYVLPNRPSFSGHGTDSIDYAWFVWHGRQQRDQGKLLVLPPTSVADRRPQRDRSTVSEVQVEAEPWRT
jgi:hypothetical protein